MTLLNVCEPLFQYICRFNRLIRLGGEPDESTVRSEIETLFGRMRSTVAENDSLRRQFDKIERPLMFFVDYIMVECDHAIAETWGDNRLAFERGELSGDEKFFDLLDETFKDDSDEANERLVIFYTCIGLGFSGIYSGQPDYLRKKMREIATRITPYLRVEKENRICPEAYENADTRIFLKDSGSMFKGLKYAVALLCILFIGVNIYLYQRATSALSKHLKTIRSYELDERKPAAGGVKPQPARKPGT